MAKATQLHEIIGFNPVTHEPICGDKAYPITRTDLVIAPDGSPLEEHMSNEIQQEVNRQLTEAEAQHNAAFNLSEQKRQAIFNQKEAQRDAAVQELANAENRIKNVENAVSDLGPKVNRLHRDMGYNAAEAIVRLEAGQNGKYVKCATRTAASNADFSISKPFEVEACSEVLIKTGFNPSDASHAELDLSVISFVHEIERNRWVQKKNAQNELLYYAVTIDENGDAHPTDEETIDVTGYPVTVLEKYTDTVYTPNNEDRWVAIPDSGYYVANIPDTAKIVVSYKPRVTDTEIIIVKHGAYANIVSQLGMLAFKERLPMTQAVAQLKEEIDALRKMVLGNIGNIVGNSVDVANDYKVGGYPCIMWGHGVPSEAVVPDNLPNGLPWDGIPPYVGHIYINLDASASPMYVAVDNDAVANYKNV